MFLIEFSVFRWIFSTFPSLEPKKAPVEQLFRVPVGFRKVPKLPAHTICSSGGVDGEFRNFPHTLFGRARGFRKVHKLPAHTVSGSGGVDGEFRNFRPHTLFKLLFRWG